MTPQERKVMEMALEALESVWQYGSDTLSGPVKGQLDNRKWQRDGVLEMTNRAYRPIKAIKEALAQPEQTAQQEPVGVVINEKVYSGFGEHRPVKTVQWRGTPPSAGVNLYTTPQQRAWVGLTDEERDAIFELHHTRLGGLDYRGDEVMYDEHFEDATTAIYAKLKQKNGYTEEKNA